MSNEFKTEVMKNGAVRQASVQKTPAAMIPNKANGLLLRAVVVATYVKDSPVRTSSDNYITEPNPVGIYCDCLVVSQRREGRLWVLQKVLVAQERSGIHNGKPWVPRASSFAVVPGGGPSEAFDPNVTNPAIFDGDHVLIGFIDDSLQLPVILKALPHPLSDLGKDSTPTGSRVDLRLVDGSPSFERFNGTFFGVDPGGNFVIDTTSAYNGQFGSDGTETTPSQNGTNGNVTVNLQEMATLTVKIGGGATVKFEKEGGATKMTVGDGAVSIAIADHLQTFYGLPADTTKISGAHNLHQHPTAVGPSGPPTFTFPVWDSSINSSKNKITDG